MTLDDVLTTWGQPHVLRLAGLSLLSVLLWRVPVVGLLFYPFRLFNTYIHEISHGLAAVLTGGTFERFVVYPNRAGLAHVRGGNRFVVASAGYLGSALFGGALILLAASASQVQQLLLGLGVALAVLCLLFVRNIFGIVAGLLLALALAAAGRYFSEARATLLFTMLALQTPLSAVDSLADLLRISLRPQRGGQPSDAHLVARYTGIPAIIWALLWCLFALAIIVATVTLAFRDQGALGAL